MSTTPIGAHILQSPYILLHLSSQVVLDLHIRQFCRELHDRRILQAPDFRPRMDVKLRHQALRDLWPDTEETLEGALRGIRFCGKAYA
jgi:hypothetical protein